MANLFSLLSYLFNLSIITGITKKFLFKGRMGLRLKILSLIAITMIILMVGVALVLKTVIIHQFVKIEEREVVDNIERFGEAFNNQLTAFANSLYSWSAWDESYQYINTRNQKFVRTTMTQASIVGQGINLIAYFDLQQKLIYGITISKDDKKIGSLNYETLMKLQEKNDLFQFKGKSDYRSAIFDFISKRMVVVSRPVTTTDSKAAVNGTVIMGYEIDDDLFNKIGKTTRLKIDVSYLDWNDHKKYDVGVRIKNEEIIEGVHLIKDKENNGLVLVKVVQPRNIYLKAKEVINFVLLITIVAMSAIMVILMLLLDRYVLRKISSLSDQIGLIEQERDWSRQITLSDQSEFQKISASINTLLAAVYKADNDLRLLLNSSGDSFLSIDHKGIVGKECSREAFRIFGSNIRGKKLSSIMGEAGQYFEDDFMEVAFSGAHPIEDLIPLLPKKILLNEMEIHLNYKPVLNSNEELISILIIAKDLTMELLVKEMHEIENRQNRTLIQILKFKNYFLDLYFSAKSLSQLTDNLPEFKQVVHTLKGGTGFLECEELTWQCYECEQEVAQRELLLSKEELKNYLLETAHSITERWELFIKSNSDILGNLDDLKKEITVVEYKIFNLENEAIRLDSPDSLIKKIDELRAKEPKDVFQFLNSAYIKAASTVGKEVLGIEWLDSVSIIEGRYRSLFSTFIHIVTNSADHGLESPLLRERMGKPRAGKIVAQLKLKDDLYELTFEDDGSGINKEEIVNKAKRRGLAIPQNDSEIERLILLPGFSSKEGQTSLSGRGVGLSAVLEEVKKFGGDLLIENRPSLGFKISVNFKMVTFKDSCKNS